MGDGQRVRGLPFPSPVLGEGAGVRPEDGRETRTAGVQRPSPWDPCQLSPGGTSKTLLKRRLSHKLGLVSQASRAPRS